MPSIKTLLVSCFIFAAAPFLLGSNIVKNAYRLIQHDGGNLAQRSTLNFTGPGVGCADASSVTTCTIGGGSIFIGTASATVANTTVETTLLSTGVGTLTLPADFLSVGRSVSLYVSGIHSAAGNPTIRIRVYLGSTVILDSTAIAAHAGTNFTFALRGQFTCRSVGAMGTVFAQGVYQELDGGGSNGMSNTAATTIDTTVSQIINVTAEWGTTSPSDTITQTNVVISSEQVM